MTRLARAPEGERRAIRNQAERTAEPYAMPRCAARALALYEQLIDSPNREHAPHDAWRATVRTIGQECRILSNVVEAGTQAAFDA